MFLKQWECQGTQNLYFFKLHMILESNLWFGEGLAQKKGGLPPFLRQDVNKIDFSQFFH